MRSSARGCKRWEGGGKKNEGWRSKGWLARQEERKNFSMMKQSALLSDWTRLPPMGRPAPWQQALSPREKQPYPSTPPYFFSLLFSLTTLVYPQLQSSMYLSLGILVKTKTTHTDTQRAASWVTYSLNNTAQLQTKQTHRGTPA